MPADALIDGDYRYALWRGDAPYVLWVMLNPSTADAQTDDPTIRKCMKYARAWGYGGIVVVNLFAYRATDPDELVKVEDPVGRDNDQHILAMARSVKQSQLEGKRIDPPLVMCAWGAKVPREHHARPARVLELLAPFASPGVLQVNNDGSPKHPLYCKDELTPTRWAR